MKFILCFLAVARLISARALLATVAACFLASFASADSIFFSGVITQSTQDGTGPAVNNPALNGIADGDPYSVELDFPGHITGPGAFNPLPGASIIFTDGSIVEASFISAYLTVSVDSNPSLYDVFLLGCLSTGSGCYVGNSLSASFAVPASDFNSSNAPATFIPGLFPPLDLLEDDGVTDIQGTVSGFSNSGVSSTGAPEPSSVLLLAAALAALCLVGFGQKRRFGK
jgi:hypothetical protein